MKKSLALLDQLIEIEVQKDLAIKQEARKKSDFALSTGEAQIVFHLKKLKELILQEQFEIKEVIDFSIKNL